MVSFYSVFKSVFEYFGRYRLINDRQDKAPYLERYYLLLKERETFPFNIFIHKFLKSDSDDLHDHPWPFISIPLYPGYWEHTEKGKFWRGPFNIRYEPATTYHRVELLKEKPYCWTIFIPGKRERQWGFKTEGGWVDNNKYLVQKKIDKEDNEDNEKSKLLKKIS